MTAIKIDVPDAGRTDLPLDVASLVLTKNSVFVGVGHAFDPHKLCEPRISKVVLVEAWEIFPERNGDFTTLKTLQRAIDHLFAIAPKVTHITLSSFGPLLRFGKDDHRDHLEYGRLAEITNYPNWSGRHLYHDARAHISKHARDVVLLVGLDVNHAALGEHYWRFERDAADVDEIARLARFSTAYVKISQSVNVGFTNGGWIAHGRHHPQMSVYRPHRIDNDKFTGVCSVHGDCIEGLTSLSAIERRVSKRKRRPVLFRDIDENDPVWDITAHYIADLCHTVTAMITPRRIAFGGVVFRGPKDSAAWSERFVAKIRAKFDKALVGKRRNTRVPHYADLDLEQFMSHRTCKAPGLFGGLIVARWDKYEVRPLGRT